MNSLDAMTAVTDRRRELRIRSERNSHSIMIQVQDAGAGFDAGHAASIFDPFFTTKDHGIGMGLAISRSIVEAHGGRLWAEPRTPHGAILSFTLPIPADAQ
jgi:C4-dicarboxylate-specific signal transduction histidine kinase